MKLPSYPQSLKELPKFCREVIDYLRASHINNVVNGTIKESPSGSTIVCGINDSLGRKKGVVENTYPWRVTAGSSGTVNIAAGHIMGYYTTYADDQWGTITSGLTVGGNLSAAAVVLAAGHYYEGGNEAVTGSQFIYAEVTRTDPSLVYSEAGAEIDTIYVETELADQARPPDYTEEPFEVAGIPVIVLSDDPPHIYAPTSNYAAVCIAKVTNVDGVISITQYVTHNPTVFIPVINVIGSPVTP